MHLIRRFSEKSSDHYDARVIQSWQILIGFAKRRETVTYGDLSVLMLGKWAPRSKAMRLGQLLSYCKLRGLPQLPVIVVTAKSKSKRPAELAPYSWAEVENEQKRVFDFDWYDVFPPLEADLG
jgi:hypothetical protein